MILLSYSRPYSDFIIRANERKKSSAHLTTSRELWLASCSERARLRLQPLEIELAPMGLYQNPIGIVSSRLLKHLFEFSLDSSSILASPSACVAEEVEHNRFARIEVVVIVDRVEGLHSLKVRFCIRRNLCPSLADFASDFVKWSCHNRVLLN